MTPAGIIFGVIALAALLYLCTLLSLIEEREETILGLLADRNEREWEIVKLNERILNYEQAREEQQDRFER